MSAQELAQAATQGRLDDVERLLLLQDHGLEPQTALLAAIQAAQANVVHWLVQQGFDIST